MCRGYRVVHDGPFAFDDGEIGEVRWVTFAELEHARPRTFLPDSLAMLLPLTATAEPFPLSAAGGTSM